MPEYISRETLRDLMYTEAFDRDTGLQRWDSGLWIRYKLFENCLDAIPAADVAPVRHGRWEQVEILHVEDLKEEDKDCISIASMFCPKCKRYHSEVYMYGSPTESVRYCPNCGAVMDGGQNDAQ